jgi:ArsR family transcriptional regulator
MADRAAEVVRQLQHAKADRMKTATIHPDRVFRALSDWTRLRILNLLQGGEVCVCDLVGVLESPQPTVSRHLAYLRKAGLVQARKDGVWAYYQLVPAKSDFERAIRTCIDVCGSEPPFSKDATLLRQRQSSCCE